MYEGYERQKHKNATGVIQWSNNAWPSNLWHLDSYLIGGGATMVRALPESTTIPCYPMWTAQSLSSTNT